MYLKEIGQYPLINGAREKNLRKELKLVKKKQKSLARSNLRLVVSIAKNMLAEVRT